MEEWKELRREIGEKLKEIFRPIMLLYFLTVVVLVGGLGAWIQLYRLNYGNFFESLGTYAVAILASASFELVMPNSDRISKSLRMLGYAALLVGIVLTIPTMHANSLWEGEKYFLSVAPAVVLTIISWFLWTLASSDNTKLLPQPLPEAAIGGSADIGLQGTTDGFKT